MPPLPPPLGYATDTPYELQLSELSSLANPGHFGVRTAVKTLKHWDIDYLPALGLFAFLISFQRWSGVYTQAVR